MTITKHISIPKNLRRQSDRSLNGQAFVAQKLNLLNIFSFLSVQETLQILRSNIYGVVHKYKKYNRYADRFQETYPDAKNETTCAETKGEGKGE